MKYGFIHQGTLTTEQEAAFDWLESTDNEVWTVELESLQSQGRGPPDDEDDEDERRGRGPGHPNLSAFDALWWHRDHAINEFSAVHDDRVQTQLTEFVEDGGGLLLTQRAFEAAAILGIESFAPDSDAANMEGSTYGFSKRDLYTGHPVFEGIDERDFTTKTTARDHHDTALYWSLNSPQDGEVLAYLARDGSRSQANKTLVSWYLGAGAVLGAATCIRFTDATEQAHRDNLTNLLDNLLGYLPEGAERRLPGENRPRGEEGFLELRKRLADNPYRPRYHFAPPANWNNDPCGLVEYDGLYHLFYQFNPHGDFWGNMHWGHAVSEDLIHWEDRPIALNPEPGEHGEFGIFTGCGVNAGDEAVFFYTGVGPEVHLNGSDQKQLPCRAAGSSEDLTDIAKYEDNPLMETPPMGAFSPPYDGDEADVPLSNPTGFRDHHVWQEDDGYWYHIIGSGLQGGVGAAIVFRAEDLYTDDWEFHTTITGDRVRFWECSQLFNFETKSLVHWSWGFIGGDVGYNLGEWDASAGEFTIEEQGYLAHGEYYAPQAMTTSDDRYVMFGWVTPLVGFEDGWADTMMTLPHTLSEDEAGRLRIQPSAEVANARSDEHDPIKRSDFTLSGDGSENPLAALEHDSVEIDLTVEPDGASEVTLNVLEHPDGEEVTRIVYDFEAETLTVDHSQSEVGDRQIGSSRQDHRTVDVTPNDDGSVDLHVFVDRSIVEVFANEDQYTVSRVYPTFADSERYSIETDGDVRVESLSAYRMGAIWEHLEAEGTDAGDASVETTPRSANPLVGGPPWAQQRSQRDHTITARTDPPDD